MIFLFFLTLSRDKPVIKAKIETTLDVPAPEPKVSLSSSPRASVSSNSTAPSSPVSGKGGRKKPESPPPRPQQSALERLDTLIKGSTLEKKVNGEPVAAAGATTVSHDVNLKGFYSFTMTLGKNKMILYIVDF